MNNCKKVEKFINAYCIQNNGDEKMVGMSIGRVVEGVEQVLKKDITAMPEILKKLSEMERAEDYGKITARVVDYFVLKQFYPDARKNEKDIEKQAKEGVVAIIRPTQTIVLGQTYKIKKQLKKAGFRWDPDNKWWYKFARWGEKVLESKVDLDSLRNITSNIYVD